MKDKQLLLAVLAQLEREKAVSIPQLAQLLNVPEEQVTEALDILVYAYDSASIRLDLHESYATLETYGTDRLLRLTASEADALVDALSSAGFTAEDELVQSLLQTKTVLENASDPRLHVISSNGKPQVLEALSAACEDPEHHLVEITYRGMKDEGERPRVIEPRIIFSEDDKRYLLAFCRDVDAWRTFRLDRITTVAPLEEQFAPRPDAPAPSVNLDEETEEAQILFSAGSLIPPWKNARVSETQSDGSFVVRVPWTGTQWLVRQVVSLMGKAIVLAPKALEDACCDYARALLQNLGGE